MKTIDWRALANKWITIRLLPIDVDDANSLVYTGSIWVKKEIEKDGKVKEVSFSRVAGGFSPKTGTFKNPQKIDPFVAKGVGRLDVKYVVQGIARDIPTSGKKSKPTPEEAKKGLLLGSNTWTPVRVVELPQSVINMISGFKTINIVKKDGKKVEYDVTHEKYGCDIQIKYTPDVKGPNKWTVSKGERRALTDEEKKYARWSLKPIVEAFSSLSLEQAELDFEKEMGEGSGNGGGKGQSGKSSSTSKSGKSGKGNYYTDGENDDDDDKPLKVKAAKKNGKKDEDEEDDDEEVTKKLKKGKKSKNDKDSKSSKSKVKSKIKSKAKDDDDDDDDDGGSKKKKKKSSSSSSSNKKSSKSSKKKKKKDDDNDDIPF